MILDSIKNVKTGDIFLTKTEKVWTFPTDNTGRWRTATDPWPTEYDLVKGNIKLLGPTTLVVWSE